MKQILSASRRTIFGTTAALFLFTVASVSLPAPKVAAAGLLYRSLQLSSSAPGDETPPTGNGETEALAGSAANGEKVSHTYIFQVPTHTQDIRSMTFKYCDDPFGYIATCGAVDGFSATNAPDAQVSVGSTGTFEDGDLTFGASTAFTTTATDDYNITISNATGVNPDSTGAARFVRVVFTASASEYFTNPDAAWLNNVTGNESRTFFGRITTFNSQSTQDNSTLIDEGTVTSSGANLITINTRVQETLKFSVGGNGGHAGNPVHSANAGNAACDALNTTPSGGTVEGQLTLGDTNQSLSATAISETRSYVRIATNASRGAQILYAGQTLRSTAGDEIAALTTQTTPAASTPQFGLAVLASGDNTGPDANANYDELVPVTAYLATGGYNFSTASNTAPVKIAESDGVIGCETLPIGYTASIDNETPAGLYSTKISYIAVPSY